MGKQAAQAQATKEEEITAQESIEMVKCLIRVSIYHVCFMRGLFPDKYFRGVDMANLENLHIKMLNQCEGDNEVQMIVDWVEAGVPDAIKRRYLKRIFFGISEDAEGKRLLEEYVFSMSYDEQGFATFQLGNRGRNRFSSQAINVKYEVVRLMRMLVQITQTLEKVPDDRYIFMKLTYHDHTPDEYEPPHFKATDNSAAAFARKPFTMEVGRVGTKHHQVSLHIKSVLDTLALEGEEQMVEDNMTVLQQQTTTAAPTNTTAAPTCSDLPPSSKPAGSEAGGSCAGMSVDSLPGAQQPEQEEEESMGGHSMAGPGHGAAWRGPQRQQHRLQEQSIRDLYTQPGSETEPQGGQAALADMDGSPVTDAQREEELASLRAWLLKRSSVHAVDAMARFGNISSSRLDSYFHQLQQERLLLPIGDAETFKVIKPASAPHRHSVGSDSATGPRRAMPASSAGTAANCARAMQHLSVADAGKGRAAPAPAPLPVASDQGGIWDAAGGTQQTQSMLGPAAGRAPLRPSQEQSPAPHATAAGVFLDCTQPNQTGEGAKRFKQSIAKEFIKQTGKRRMAEGQENEEQPAAKGRRAGGDDTAALAPATKPRTRKPHGKK